MSFFAAASDGVSYWPFGILAITESVTQKCACEEIDDEDEEVENLHDEELDAWINGMFCDIHLDWMVLLNSDLQK